MLEIRIFLLNIGKSRLNAKLKRYYLTFSGAGTAHNLYCNV